MKEIADKGYDLLSIGETKEPSEVCYERFKQFTCWVFHCIKVLEVNVSVT